MMMVTSKISGVNTLFMDFSFINISKSDRFLLPRIINKHLTLKKI